MNRASAVAIHNGRILAIGDRSQIEPLLGKSTKIIDAGGMTVTPGNRALGPTSSCANISVA